MTFSQSVSRYWDALKEADWQQLESLWPFWLLLGVVLGTAVAPPLSSLARLLQWRRIHDAKEQDMPDNEDTQRLPLLSHAFYSRIIMAVGGAMFLQSLWQRYVTPGAFQRFCSCLFNFVRGEGWVADDDKLDDSRSSDAGDAKAAWYVTRDDLDFFKSRVERKDPIDASPWEVIVKNSLPGLQYTSYRRKLRDIGKTEYLSVSLTANTTPHEVMDFYLSDTERQGWDNMLAKTEVVEDGDFAHREQVVHWVRSFPFAFLSDRDYIIARRLFDEDGVLYGISKVIRYPGYNPQGTVQMRTYWSMWSVKAIPCPFGSAQPATETILLHMEDFQIAEHLARFAVKCGMWGFIKKMTPHMERFVQSRRARGVDPLGRDPLAFGHPTEAGASGATGGAGMVAEGALSRRRGPGNGERLRKVASAVVATGLIVLCSGLGGRIVESRRSGESRRRRRRRGPTSASDLGAM